MGMVKSLAHSFSYSPPEGLRAPQPRHSRLRVAC